MDTLSDSDEFDYNNRCITITFGDIAENGSGMQKLGQEVKSIFKVKYLKKLANQVEGTEIIDLIEKSKVKEKFKDIKPTKACVLVIRNYVKNSKDLFKELIDLKWDSKALFRGEVKNKIARHNLCFADAGMLNSKEKKIIQKPKYNKGKGTVYNFAKLPLLKQTRESVQELVDMNALVAEGNLY